MPLNSESTIKKNYFHNRRIKKKMLCLFTYLGLSATGLPLDDTYHNGVAGPMAEYWVQGYKKAAILVILNKSLAADFTMSKREYSQTEFTKVSFTSEDRGEGKEYTTLTYKPDTENPFLLQLKTTSTEPVNFAIRYVHTAPVYRVSAVLGTFDLFICLFLLVFGWTIFCGACRATRKR